MAKGVSFALFLICALRLGICYFYEEQEPTYLIVRVGHYVLLNCEVDYDEVYVVPYMVHWKKDVRYMYN